MTGLFRSKSCGLVGLTEFNDAPPSPFFHQTKTNNEEANEEEEEEEFEEDEEEENDSDGNPIATTPFISPTSRFRGSEGRNSNSTSKDNNQLPFLDILAALLRKSLVTCSVDTNDVSSMDISWPTEVRHVSHVTFDRFNGFLGLPTELEPDVPRRVPSARFGSSTLFNLWGVLLGRFAFQILELLSKLNLVCLLILGFSTVIFKM